MDISEVYKPYNSLKLGIIVLAISAFTTLAAIPLEANADSDHCQWDKSRHSEFMEKQQKELHGKLGLSASQEPAWKDFIAQMKPDEHQTKQDWSELSKLSTPDRLDHMVAKSKERQQALESHVQAIKAFYAQLTTEQKKIFDESFHFHRHGHGWFHRLWDKWHHERD